MIQTVSNRAESDLYPTMFFKRMFIKIESVEPAML